MQVSVANMTSLAILRLRGYRSRSCGVTSTSNAWEANSNELMSENAASLASCCTCQPHVKFAPVLE